MKCRQRSSSALSLPQQWGLSPPIILHSVLRTLMKKNLELLELLHLVQQIASHLAGDNQPFSISTIEAADPHPSLLHSQLETAPVHAGGQSLMKPTGLHHPQNVLRSTNWTLSNLWLHFETANTHRQTQLTLSLYRHPMTRYIGPDTHFPIPHIQTFHLFNNHAAQGCLV